MKTAGADPGKISLETLVTLVKGRYSSFALVVKRENVDFEAMSCTMINILRKLFEHPFLRQVTQVRS